MQFLQFQMAGFFDGIAIPFGYCKVYLTGTATLASLFDSGGSPMSNPAHADSSGQVGFAAADGLYDFQPYYADGVTVAGPKILKQQMFDLTNISSNSVVVATRTALAAVPAPTSLMSRYLAEAGREGWFVFSSANLSAQVSADTAQGIYVAPSGATSGASGAWVRKFVGPASVKWFGATGDGTTDDHAAFVGAIATLKVIRTQPNSGYGSGSGELFIPAGTYNLGTTTLDITHTLRIRGEGSGGGGGATVLKWNAGTTGIRVQSFNTTGATAIITPNPTDITAGQGSIIEGLLLKGNYAGTESEAHGIHLRGAATIRDCGIYDFAGDGINIHATAGSGAPNEGNDNNSRLENLLIQNCRNGVFFDGADVNACTTISLDLIGNRGFGLWDSSFLGNTHIGHQAAGNGAVAGTHPPCWVSQGGNRYVVKRGQETGASTNAPSGTTADNTWWYYYSAGAPDSTIRCPAWASGTTYRAGGAYCTDDSGSAGNNFDGCYIEGTQPFAQFVTPTLVVGGSMNPNVRGVPCLIADSNDIVSTNGLVARGNFTGLGALHSFGLPSGPTADTVFSCNSTDSFQFSFNRYDSGGSLLATDGTIIGAVNGIAYHVTSFHQFYTTAGRVLYFDVNGLNLDSGKVITINALQVVGARQTGTPADATDLATALTLVNALKAKLIAHGLIS